MRYLENLQRTWDGFAERDALWAILTDPKHKGNKWDLDRFFETGTREVRTVLDHVQSIGVQPDFDGCALDFGCGAGRLTQALAARFSSAIGVDISAKMIELAQKHNRFPNSCQYVCNWSNALPLADGVISFVYSSIALQHIAPPFVEKYLAEFIRVLKPGGVLVFQVPDRCKGQYFRQVVRTVRSSVYRALEVAHLIDGRMEGHCFGEDKVRAIFAAHMGEIKDIQFTNSLAWDFNGSLQYLGSEPRIGLVSKQYCVVK